MNLEKQKDNIIILTLIIAIPIIMLLSVNLGYSKIPFTNVIRTLFGGGTAKENLLILDFRMPRIILSVLIGMGFSLSGCIIQGITKNPLADPGLMGINSGAGIIVVLFVVLKANITFASVFALPFLSLIGAALTGFIIYRLAVNKEEGLLPIRLILNGVAIQACISAAMLLIVIRLDERQYEFIAKWQAGSIWSANWKFVISLLPWLIVCMVYLSFKTKIIDILAIGDEMSTGLGIQVTKEKYKLLFTAIALAAASVAVSGSINFVGLIAPHLARQLVGSKHRILFPVSALVGGLLVLISDTIARTLLQPDEIPTGIVVSVIGAPYFIYLLVKGKRQ